MELKGLKIDGDEEKKKRMGLGMGGHPLFFVCVAGKEVTGGNCGCVAGKGLSRGGEYFM